MTRREAPSNIEKLFSIRVGNIPDNISDETIKRDFEVFGDIADFYRPRLHHKGAPSRFAFIRYYSRDHADSALIDMSGKVYGESIITVADANSQDSFFTQDTGFITNQLFDTPKVIVDDFDPSLPETHYALKRKQQLKNIPLGQQYAVRIDDLPEDVSKEEVEEVFSSCGEVTSIYFPIDLKTRKPRGFAFVRYGDESQADEAVFQMHNTRLGTGRRIQVERVKSKTYFGQDESPYAEFAAYV